MEHRLNSHHRQISGSNDFLESTSSPVYPTTIGEPITFSSGNFTGRTLRFELKELQKAESGRKYAKVDRRPLDPPPAVMLRIYEAGDARTGSWEREILPETVENNGIVCTVDLFPVPESVYDIRSPASQASPEPSHTRNEGTSIDLQPRYPLTYYPLHPYTSLNADGGQTPVPPFQIPRRQPVLAHTSQSELPNDVVHQISNHLVTESSKLTPALVGEKFVEPTLIDYKGRKSLIFVFGDLAVRREGVFILRYRAFNIFSGVPGSPHVPVLSELFGGPFKVFSTREFPGLEPSTELTRTLAQYGVRVTLRDAERKHKKRNTD